MQHNIVINSLIFQVIIVVRPITLVMGKYRTKIKLGSRYWGNLVLDTEQCSKISRKGLEALLSERNKLVDERGSATKRKPGSGPAVGRKTARTEENVSYTLSC